MHHLSRWLDESLPQLLNSAFYLLHVVCYPSTGRSVTDIGSSVATQLFTRPPRADRVLITFHMTSLVCAKALASQLEPYKRLLGILVRQDCISIAVSNPYLNLAEPLGGLMLRDGRVSERSLTRLISSQQKELAGFILGCEVTPEGNVTASAAATDRQQQQLQQQQHSTQQQRAVQQLQVMLEVIGLQGGWYGSWSVDTAAAACQIKPSPATGAAPTSPGVNVTGGSNSSAAVDGGSSSSSSNGQQERCSLGQQFLQDYLQSLGTYNTFG